MERISFNVAGETVVGHLFLPNCVGERDALPGLAFDHRNFGESSGGIRQHEEPQKKLDDLAAMVAVPISTPDRQRPTRPGGKASGSEPMPMSSG
ncbi:hypothetical protein [Chelativorans xinjiangense]|uniref:hypothetical protein n=1 Tax=Chelativorans xinjiangense TaxID=2681485 RepID=UPI001916247E|nr:hypothetical protein [Chelativorans xinjiangense]